MKKLVLLAILCASSMSFAYTQLEASTILTTAILSDKIIMKRVSELSGNKNLNGIDPTILSTTEYANGVKGFNSTLKFKFDSSLSGDDRAACQVVIAVAIIKSGEMKASFTKDTTCIGLTDDDTETRFTLKIPKPNPENDNLTNE